MTPLMTLAILYVPFCVRCRSKVERYWPRMTFSGWAVEPSGAVMTRPSRRMAAWSGMNTPFDMPPSKPTQASAPDRTVEVGASQARWAWAAIGAARAAVRAMRAIVVFMVLLLLTGDVDAHGAQFSGP